MASRNPADVLGLDRLGTIDVGKDASFVVFDEHAQVHMTCVRGQVVHPASLGAAPRPGGAGGTGKQQPPQGCPQRAEKTPHTRDAAQADAPLRGEAPAAGRASQAGHRLPHPPGGHNQALRIAAEGEGAVE